MKRDGTGPEGKGAKTGRGQGDCAPKITPTKKTGNGRGLGRGQGGQGRGLGRA